MGVLSSGEDVTENRRAEQALRDSEEKFHAVFEQSVDAMFINSLDGSSLDANPAWLDLFGYSREELPGIRVLDIYVNPQEREDFLRHVTQAGFVDDETALRKKDGTVIYCQRTIVARKDVEGNVVAYQGIIRDVTERRRADLALRESEDKFRELFEQSRDAIHITDVDGSTVEANKAGLDLFGYSGDEMPGLHATSMYADPKDRDDFLHKIAEAGFVEEEVRLRRKDGTVMDCQRTVVARKDEQGNVVAFQSILRDITEQKQAVRALWESEEKARAALNATSERVVVLDSGGTILEANMALAEILEKSREELIGLCIWDFFLPEVRARRMSQAEQTLRSGKPTRLVDEHQGRWHDSTYYPLFDEAGRASRLVIFAQDITERKRTAEELEKHREHLEELVQERTRELEQAQEELLASERLATLGEFSGSISHELRNPLGVIDGSVYYLKARLKDADGKVGEHLDRIKLNVDKSTAIIESLLNLTRMRAPQMEKLSLAASIADALATSGVPAAVKVTRDFPEQEVFVDADAEQLRMAFKNVVKNAIEAMNGKGTLTATIHTTTDGQVEVSFADTGPGIAQENLEKVFQPLFSTRAKGIGFGLSICKMIVDRHGGTIAARSEEGTGATFIVRLPLHGAKEKEA